MTYQTGHLTLIFLILTLSITPIKRISTYLMTKYRLKYGKRLADWNWIIRLRKIFGLYSFYYACVHLSIYVVQDLLCHQCLQTTRIQTLGDSLLKFVSKF